MIEIKNVSKVYQMGDEFIYALDDINFRVKKGEFVSIVGPSGSREIYTYEYVRIIRCTRQGSILFRRY